MDNSEMRLIANAWISLHCAKEGSEEYQKNFWAFVRMGDLCKNDPENCWQLIHLIREINDDGIVLENLAAGPIEELLVNHGEYFINRVEQLAQQDDKFRNLLEMVWRNEISDSIWNRLQAVIN